MLSLREACGNAKMPPHPRSLVLDAGYYTNLLADDVVAKSFNLNLSAPGVTEGMIKRLAGFDLHETVVIPSDHAEKLVGFAAHPSAVAVAMRYLQPVAEYQQAGAVTDPQTGMTFGYLRFTDTRANKVFVTLECLYGFAAGQDRRPQAHRQTISFFGVRLASITLSGKPGGGVLFWRRLTRRLA